MLRANMNPFQEERAATEWSAIYLLVVAIIALVLIFAVVKPLFKSSQQIVQQQPIAIRTSSK
jgi:hypothetical protein